MRLTPHAVSVCAASVFIVAAANPAMAHPRCGTVEVVNRQGRPVAGAEVAYLDYDPREAPQQGGGGPEWWTTNAAGRVCEEALVAPGFLEVRASRAFGGQCVADEVAPYRGWRASAPVTRVTLPIKHIRRSRWHGRVVASDGKPVAGALVTVPLIYPKDCLGDEFGPDEELKTGGDGRFALPPLPDGKIELDVAVGGYAKKVFSVALPSEPGDLAMEVGAHWTGRVLDPDGAPIGHCAITLRSKDRIEVASACDSNGAAGFDLPHLPSGPLEVHVRIATHPTLQNRIFRDQVVIVPNERRQADIHLPAGLTLAGQVVTKTGQPMAGAWVVAISADRERSSWEGRLGAQADANGRFVFHHVAAGQWRVVADSVVTAKPEDWQTVSAGTTDLKLVSRRRR